MNNEGKLGHFLFEIFEGRLESACGPKSHEVSN